MDDIAKQAIKLYDAFANFDGEYDDLQEAFQGYLKLTGYLGPKTNFAFFPEIELKNDSRYLSVQCVAKNEKELRSTSYLSDEYYPPRDDSEEERKRQASR